MKWFREWLDGVKLAKALRLELDKAESDIKHLIEEKVGVTAQRDLYEKEKNVLAMDLRNALKGGLVE
jgi:hypothetical protein